MPGTVLKSRDRYVLKVLVRDYDPGMGFTLVEVVSHTEMPAERPPKSINEGNPMSVKAFREQYENFYGQTVSVKGWVSKIVQFPIYTIEFQTDQNSHKQKDIITVLVPYNEMAYMLKFRKEQGLRSRQECVMRIRVYKPENHTVRINLIYFGGGKTYEEYPFVIQWVHPQSENE